MFQLASYIKVGLKDVASKRILSGLLSANLFFDNITTGAIIVGLCGTEYLWPHEFKLLRCFRDFISEMMCGECKSQ